MANYPTDPTIWELDESWYDPTLISVARSGSVKARKLVAAKKRIFKVGHKFITNTQRQTIETFYDANRLLTLTFQHPISLTNYTVIFADETGPQVSIAGAGLYDINLILRQT